MANAGEVEFELLIFIFFIFSWRNLVAIAATPLQDQSGIIPYGGGNVVSEQVVVGIPMVKEVSAMCSNIGGIHASIEFDRPFSGRIYSLGYGNVHECVYFNGFYTKSLLFSIPIDNCGTRLTRNTRGVVDMLENRVYVQTDKYTLTSFDRKYAFVCELAAPNSAVLPAPNTEIREIRRRPISPTNFVEATPPKDNTDDKDIENVTAMTPIIPRNAPKGAKPMMPAMLYYGKNQWNIPPENINFKSVRLKPGGKSEQDVVEHPTVIVPIEDRTGEILHPFEPEVQEYERKWNHITENPDRELYGNRVSQVPDADLLNDKLSASPNFRRFPDNLFTSITATGAPSPKPTTSRQFTERTSIIPLFESLMSTTAKIDENPTTPLIVLPFAKQKNLNAPPREGVDSSETRTFIAGSTTSNDVDKSIYLEIKRGADNPDNSSRINGTVRIGEPIMLVVHAKSASVDPNKYNIFVHSCYSSGGSELTRIQLIDSAGCSVHPQVLGGMRRERFPLPSTKSNETPKSSVHNDGGEAQFNSEVIYYFAMRAFKFPAGDDVHFFCSVDISQDYNFPELCPSATSGPRRTRWASAITRNDNAGGNTDGGEPSAIYRDEEETPPVAGSLSGLDGGMPNFSRNNTHISSSSAEKEKAHIHGVKVSNVTFVADDAADFIKYERITGNVVVAESGLSDGLNTANVAVLTATAIVALMILVALACLTNQLFAYIRRDADLTKGFGLLRRRFSSSTIN